MAKKPTTVADPPKVAWDPGYKPGTKKPGVAAIHPRWWQLEGTERADEVVSIADGLRNDDAARRSRYLENLSLYELRSLTGLNASGYYNPASPDGVTIPVLRSLCDTVQTDIAGRQRPLPMFLTSGADWKTRRRAKKLGKFVEAVLHQPQGVYVNGWELAVDVFLDACIYGVGVIHVYVDELTHKVVLERVQPDELGVDRREAEGGDPLNLFRTRLFDEDKLIARFVDTEEDEVEAARMREAIQNAATTDKNLTVDVHGMTRIARSVLLREAYRLPLSEDEPGAHDYAVPGCTLLTEKWTRPHFPFVFFRWSRERRGFWATGLIDEAKQLAAELNYTFERFQERQRLCANRRIFVPDGANVNDADLEANEAENVIRYSGAQAPIESQVPALNPSDFQFLERVRSFCYEFPGVSQSSATARKEVGIDSGIGLRMMQDLASKRFAVKARYAYEYPYVDLARKIVAAVAEYVEATGVDITASLPRKREMRDFTWTDVRLDRDYEIQITPASSLPSDPAGRLATVQELFQAGVIGEQTFKRLLDWPDFEQEMVRERAEWEYVEDLIDKMLDYEDGKPLKYDPPDGYMIRSEQALLQVAGAYFEAKVDGANEENLKLLRRYMLALGKKIEKANAPPPAPPAPPMAPGVGGPPVDPAMMAAAAGAPPMPPGPVGPAAGPMPAAA